MIFDESIGLGYAPELTRIICKKCGDIQGDMENDFDIFFDETYCPDCYKYMIEQFNSIENDD